MHIRNRMFPDIHCMNMFSNTLICRIQNPDIPRAERFGAAQSRAAGRGGTRQDRTPRVGSPRTQPSLLPPKASKTIVLNVSSEARTKESLCKPKEEHNERLTRGLSAVYPRDDGRSSFLERHELQELEEWQRMQEEARTEQRRRLELFRRQRAQELERISYPSTRAVLGSQPLGAMGLGSLGVRPGVTTLLGSGTAVRSVPPVVELERQLNERMDMCSTTAQVSLHEDVPRGSETPTGHDESRALEVLAAKARKQDEPEAQGGPMTLDKAMTTMSSAVAKLATALNESKEASVLKWGRKKPM